MALVPANERFQTLSNLLKDFLSQQSASEEGEGSGLRPGAEGSLPHADEVASSDPCPVADPTSLKPESPAGSSPSSSDTDDGSSSSTTDDDSSSSDTDDEEPVIGEYCENCLIC